MWYCLFCSVSSKLEFWRKISRIWGGVNYASFQNGINYNSFIDEKVDNQITDYSGVNPLQSASQGNLHTEYRPALSLPQTHLDRQVFAIPGDRSSTNNKRQEIVWERDNNNNSLVLFNSVLLAQIWKSHAALCCLQTFVWQHHWTLHFYCLDHLYDNFRG